MKGSKIIENVLEPPIVDITNFAKKNAPKNKKTISFGQGIPFFSPPKLILEKLIELTLKDDSIHKYSPDEGLQKLRTLILEKHFYEGYPYFSEKNLLITAGANQAFFIILLSILNPGDEVIIFAPHYFNHVMTVQALNCKPIIVNRSETFDIDVLEFISKISSKTKAIVITNPDNPTGSVLSNKKLNQIVTLAKEHNLWIIQDETYRDFIYEPKIKPHTSIMDQENDNITNLINIYSFSKNYGMSGYRLGYMVFPELLYDNIMKIQDTLIVSPPVISQFLGTLMLEEQVYVKKWFRENLKELNMVKNFIFSEIKISPYLEINKNSLTGLGGFYIFPKLIHPSLKDSDEFSKKLIIAEGVILLPGHYFGINWKNYVRISFGNVTMDDAKEGFSRINQFLTDFKK